MNRTFLLLFAISLICSACASGVGVGAGVGIGKGGGFGFGVGLGTGTYQRRDGTGPKVAFIGESLVEGAGVSLERTFAYRAIDRLNARFAQRRMARRLEGDYAGIADSRTKSAADRVRAALKGKPEAVFLELGTNDAFSGVSPGEIEKNLDEAIQVAKQAGVPVILAGLKSPLGTPKPASEYESIYPWDPLESTCRHASLSIL